MTARIADLNLERARKCVVLQSIICNQNIYFRMCTQQLTTRYSTPEADHYRHTGSLNDQQGLITCCLVVTINVYLSYLIMLCAIATRDHTGVPTTRA